MDKWFFTFYVSGKTDKKCVRNRFYKLLFLKFQLATIYLHAEQLNIKINVSEPSRLEGRIKGRLCWLQYPLPSLPNQATELCPSSHQPLACIGGTICSADICSPWETHRMMQQLSVNLTGPWGAQTFGQTLFLCVCMGVSEWD